MTAITTPTDTTAAQTLEDVRCVEPKRAREVLSCSLSHVYDLMDAGILPTVYLRGAKRIPERALIEFVVRGGDPGPDRKTQRKATRKTQRAADGAQPAAWRGALTKAARA